MSRSNKRRRAHDNSIKSTYVCIINNDKDKDSLLSGLRSLYEEKKLCDVSFRVRGSIYSAHRVVLAATPTFFSPLMMSGMQESHQSIIDIDADPHLFQAVLDYIYGKEITVSSSMLIPLLGLASCYAFSTLRDQLADSLFKGITIENCCHIFAAADKHACHDLRERTLEIIFNNFASICKTQSFFELPHHLLECVLRSDNIMDCDEALVFEAVARWIEKLPTEKQTEAQGLLNFVRFPLMDSCLLSDVIKNHPIMNGLQQKELLLEAFEHHSLRAVGRNGRTSHRMTTRKQSCSFTKSTMLNGHQDSVSALMVWQNKYLISGSWDTSIKVWAPLGEIDSESSLIAASASELTTQGFTSLKKDLESWTCIKTLSTHAGAVRSLCICGDKVISCSDDGIIIAWTPASWTCARVMEGHDGAANALLECDNRLVSAGDDGTIKLWNTSTWLCEVTLHHSVEPNTADDENTPLRVGVLSLETCNNFLFSGGDDCIVRIWNINNWNCVQLLRAHKDEVWALKIIEDKTLLTGSLDGTIRVWNCRQENTSSSIVVIPIHSLDEYSGDNLVETTPSTAYCNETGNMFERSEEMHVEGSSSSDPTSPLRINITGFKRNDRDLQIGLPSQSIQHSSSLNPPRWECDHIVESGEPVYALCSLDGRLVSAGASSKISVWRSTAGAGYAGAGSGAGGSEAGGISNRSWMLFKHFTSEDEGIWCLTVCKGHLISGGFAGTVRVWT